MHLLDLFKAEHYWQSLSLHQAFCNNTHPEDGVK